MSICKLPVVKNSNMHSQGKALVVSFSTTDDLRQLQKMAAIACSVLDEEQARKTLVKHGGLVVLGTRLLQALHDHQCVEKASLVSDVMRILLRCDEKYTKEFTERVGVSLVYELIDFLQIFAEESSRTDKLNLFLYDLALLPWSALQGANYGRLVQILQRTVREARTPQICATSIYILSELADDLTKKRFLVDCPGLVEDVLAKVSKHGRDSQAMAMFSIRFFRRLAWGSPNRATLARKKLWQQVLLELAISDEKGVREEAFETVRQMSIETESRQRMVNYDDATLVKHLVESLNCPRFSEAAAQTLSSLVVDETSVKKLASYPGILHRLSSFAMKAEATLGTMAAKILKRMASYISIREKGHQDLIEALINCAGSPRTSVRRWAARGLLVQSESSTNAFFITRSQPVLQAVFTLSTDPDPRVRKSAIQTLYNAASEASNTRRAAYTTQYLNAFVSNSSGYHDTANYDALSTKRLSIRGILKLSDHPKNYHRVAKQKGTIESLARYGVSSDTDEELKGAALHAVVILSPYL
eukprot:scaffold4740_cov165-Amphora_coffeaeformis.AAC.16